MAPGWSRRTLIDNLVNAESAVDFDIPLAELPRASHELTSTDGTASGHVRFSRQSGQAVADLTVRAMPGLTCQRCMQPMRWPVDETTRIALLTEQAAADRVPDEMEVFQVEGDSVSVRDLVDEEVMVALPHVPLHDDDSECAGRELTLPGQEADAEDSADAQVQKPFAQLGELLKRK